MKRLFLALLLILVFTGISQAASKSVVIVVSDPNDLPYEGASVYVYSATANYYNIFLTDDIGGVGFSLDDAHDYQVVATGFHNNRTVMADCVVKGANLTAGVLNWFPIDMEYTSPPPPAPAPAPLPPITSPTPTPTPTPPPLPPITNPIP